MPVILRHSQGKDCVASPFEAETINVGPSAIKAHSGMTIACTGEAFFKKSMARRPDSAKLRLRGARSIIHEVPTVSVSAERGHRAHPVETHQIHPFQAVFVAGTVPLFLGAVLSDAAYSATYEVQWTNFASWLIAGGLVFTAIAVVLAGIDLFHAKLRTGRPLLYAILLLATWFLGFVNALIHARDAWAAMPTGLVLSIIVLVLACAATWVGFSTLRTGGAE